MVALAVGAWAVAVQRRRVSGRRLGEGQGAVSEKHPRARAVFRVSSSAREQELDLRLPSVAGTAHNADIVIGGAGASAYHVRFSSAPGGVSALDLTDGRGMYCGDACVLSAELGSGESVRVGDATITLLRTYEA
jgi:hypothetical protein